MSTDSHVSPTLRSHSGGGANQCAILRYRKRRRQSTKQSGIPVLQHAIPHVHFHDNHDSIL